MFAEAGFEATISLASNRPISGQKSPISPKWFILSICGISLAGDQHLQKEK